MAAFRRLSLPAQLRTRLMDYCALAGEDPEAVLADAVALHLDELGERLVEELPMAPEPDLFAAGGLA